MTKQEYTTVTGSAVVAIAKAAGSISYATPSINKNITDAAFTNALTQTGDGTVSYKSDAPTVATVDESTGQVTIIGAGEATITATVADSDTYTYATKTATYTVTVKAQASDGGTDPYTPDNNPYSW